MAEEALWAIQQKKLFNLQCQWRAEQIRLKGVEHSTQFLLLSANIQHCPHISPVSRAEVELYCSFLRSGLASHPYSFDNWQDYEAFKAEYESGSIPGIENDPDQEHIPSWYSFYDEHMGTTDLLNLPDIRGEKENRYRSISRQIQLENMRKENPKKATDSRPYLSIYDSEMVESFVRKFEDKRTLKFCKAVENFQLQMDENMEVEDALETLRASDMKIPVRAHADWKDAIIAAAKQYEFEQVAQMLPIIHQEYVFRVENSINFSQSMVDKKKEEYAFQLCEMARQQIIEGRLHCGEPDNMRF